MEAIRLRAVVKKDGEVVMTGLPCKKGERVEMILLIQPAAERKRRPLTARQLRRSGLIGLWKYRKGVPDSATYARQLREQAQRRRA